MSVFGPREPEGDRDIPWWEKTSLFGVDGSLDAQFQCFLRDGDGRTCALFQTETEFVVKRADLVVVARRARGETTGVIRRLCSWSYITLTDTHDNSVFVWNPFTGVVHDRVNGGLQLFITNDGSSYYQHGGMSANDTTVTIKRFGKSGTHALQAYIPWSDRNFISGWSVFENTVAFVHSGGIRIVSQNATVDIDIENLLNVIPRYVTRIWLRYGVVFVAYIVGHRESYEAIAKIAYETSIVTRYDLTSRVGEIFGVCDVSYDSEYLLFTGRDDGKLKLFKFDTEWTMNIPVNPFVINIQWAPDSGSFVVKDGNTHVLFAKLKWSTHRNAFPVHVKEPTARLAYKFKSRFNKLTNKEAPEILVDDVMQENVDSGTFTDPR